MAQENDTDMPTKFSTLNVNAMEFVPSFCTDRVATAAPTETLNEKTPENPGKLNLNHLTSD